MIRSVFYIFLLASLIFPFLLANLIFQSLSSFAQYPDTLEIDVNKGYLNVYVPKYTLFYTKEASEANIEGEVILQFDLTESCKIENASIVQALGYGFDEEVMKLPAMMQKKLDAQKLSKCPETPQLKIPITFTQKPPY